MMHFNRKQGRFLSDVIARWQADGAVDPETAAALKSSYAVRPFDWGRLAKYSFIIAILCAVIAAAAIAADAYFIELVERLLDSSDSALSLVFGCLAAAVFLVGYRMRRQHPGNVFSNESVLLAAVLLAALSIAFLGKALDNGSGHFSLLLLLAAVLYGVVGLTFGSRLVWIFSLLSLGGWFGAETGYVSGWGAYWLGLNYPLRFALFGAALTVVAHCFKRGRKTAPFFSSTYKMGLLCLFISLWILSIFGNYGDVNSWWRHSDKTALLHWSVLFGVVAIAAICRGLKHDDGVARGFGLTFLFINLYTKYFECFWDTTHKAVFFLVLAVSFWLVGRKAEAIWNLEFIGKDAEKDAQNNGGTEDGQ